MNPRIDWYFDFISPFAFLQWHKLRRDASHVTVTPYPLLFAGLLSHWDNKGPVEIPPKRGWTYAHCLWIAKREGIALRLPSAHPFNPYPYCACRLPLAQPPTLWIVCLISFGRMGIYPPITHRGKRYWMNFRSMNRRSTRKKLKPHYDAMANKQ